MKKWECTVCGYIHEGDQPPDVCPVCGAGAEYFKEIIEEQEKSDSGTDDSGSAAPSSAESSADAGGSEPTGLAALVLNFHLHPITVHTPNGVLPLALVFLVLAIVFGLSGFERAAFYNLVFVLLTMPVVILTGYLEWQNRYKGIRTKIFTTKIAASIIVTVSLAAMVIWTLVDPEVTRSSSRWLYLLVGLVMVGAAGIAGHLGGKLVFDKRDR